MGNRFIPSGDYDFASMARGFAGKIEEDPQRFCVSQTDSATLSSAAADFTEKLRIAMLPGMRSEVSTREKNAARAEAKRIISKLAQMIRVNDQVDDLSKKHLKIPERPSRLKRKACPMEPPMLRFVRAIHQSTASTPMHELRFLAVNATGKSKPEGAVRLELFVDLVPPDEKVPEHPGANHGGRPWYLRSYTKSPIILTPPMARVPMRVVYWARWADSAGNYGPFSATAAAWVEGGNISRIGLQAPGTKQIRATEHDQPAANRESTYTVALIEAHYLSFNSNDITTDQPKLEATVMRETKQIEGPVEAEAA